MTTKRRAELQRKLSMTSVPKPPAGLSERLKAEIPQNLMSVERDRARLSRSTLFTMRVAASIMLLVVSAYLALHLGSRLQQTKVASEPPSMIQKRPASIAQPQAELTVTLAENEKDVNSGRVAEVAPAVERPQSANVVETRERQTLTKTRRALDQPADRYDDERALREERDKLAAATGVSAAAPALAPVTPAPMPAPVAPPPQPVVADADLARSAAKSETISVTAEAPAFITNAQAASLSFDRPRAVFGLSIDPEVFRRVKQELERGQRPITDTSDVSALINYFAEDGRAPRRDLGLDVEASRAPLADDNTALLRFTIDTPRETIPPGGSTPPAATDASLDIRLNSNVVLSHRLIGADALKTQSTILKNVSVTGVMDMKLKPAIPPRTTIATLRLHYRSVVDGKQRTITREVHAADVQRTWASASRRHRLPTLSAAWSESLTEGGATCDVARTAEKLATEEPDDSRAKELAAVASASCRLRSSSPTGSGR